MTQGSGQNPQGVSPSEMEAQTREERKIAELRERASKAASRAAQLRARAEREEAKMRTRADAKDAVAFRSQETKRRLMMGDLMLEYARLPGSKGARQFVIRRIEEQDDSVRELCETVRNELKAIKEPPQPA
jgi:hypothetical protein